MDTHAIMVAGLVIVAVSAVGFAVMPYLTGEVRAEARRENLIKPGAKENVARSKDNDNKRKQVAESLKEIDHRLKKKLTLETRFMQAGLNWTRGKYYVISTFMAIASAALVFVVSHSLWLAVVMAGVGFWGLPLWLLTFFKKRRLKAFTEAFPPAIDIIIRGIKSGLPLGDCLKIISSEAQEPVRSEFRQIVETQMVGLTATEAIERLVDRVPSSEASFFAIVIGIQQKAGGNLAEALANLSKVLRERKKMKQKIKAMSSEATASAGIIGSLPIAVTTLIYFTSPKYMSILFNTSSGNFVIVCSLFWMFCGIMVMKKMISFDF
ncbi:MAG: type II secretion system F family protein [Hyphomicrobiales bacterium]|nr:type II secretion system F family protein [Hyphomicrobiales bacterium]MDE2114378.1 type II secretion system F family protein [Hyphomicrobiales bacterium]